MPIVHSKNLRTYTNKPIQGLKKEVFMNIKISSVHFDADKKLLEFVDKKLNKLIKLYDDITAAEVFLRLENKQDIENKLVEIKLFIPGNDLFAKKQSKSFEESTDIVIEALRQQIIKHKEKLRGV